MATPNDQHQENKHAMIEALHAEIDRCMACKAMAPDLAKPSTMRRGDIGSIMVVGQAPGNREVKSGTAFSGHSGNKLMEWLILAGADSTNPRKGIYFTAILKCLADTISFAAMAHRCRRFLFRQIEIIRPQLIITLGQCAYEELRLENTPYTDALCALQTSEGTLLTTPFGYHFTLLPWPHPSGRNLWLNDSANLVRLNESFQLVRPYLR